MTTKQVPIRGSQEVFNELATARDEARVRLHLLSLEARDRWRELETKIDALEQGISERGEKMGEAAAARARDLTQLVKSFIRSHQRSTTEPSTPVRAIMTEAVQSCSPSDSLNRAAQILWETNCGAAPVVAADGSLVGVITDRDVCMAAYTQGRPLADIAVESAMSREVCACAAEDSIGQALGLMAQRQVRRLLVRTPDGRLAGIVALADLARWVHSLDNGRSAAADALATALAEISLPSRAAPPGAPPS